MQRRTEGWFALAMVAGAVVVAAVVGRSCNAIGSRDTRPSTFVTGPEGASALAEALGRLGVEVSRYRRRLGELPRVDADGDRVAMVVLQPSLPLGPSEVRALVEWQQGQAQGDLVLAGSSAQPAMACFGWSVGPALVDPVEVRSASGQVLEVTRLLVPSDSTLVTDSTLAGHGDPEICKVPPALEADTLWRGADGQVAMVRVRTAPGGASVLLAPEVGPFRNRALRDRELGAEVLGLFAGRYDRVWFDERHHGFRDTGSLPTTVLAWSRTSPWGWAVWQLLAVGLLALLVAAVRFGPVRPGVERQRRSPLEHVRALAAALAARRGHDIAIAALLRGLRRRLQPGVAPGRDPREWLVELQQHTRAPGARAAAARLAALTAPGQDSTAVLRAAHAVEDLWQELR